MFLYPLRPAVLGWLLGLALAAAVIQFFTGVLEVHWLPRFEIRATSGLVAFAGIGLILELFWWVLAFKIAVEAMRAAAHGLEHESIRAGWIDDTQAVRQLVLWSGLLLLGYLLFLQFGSYALGGYCLLLVLLMPAMLVMVGMGGGLTDAFDVRAWRVLFNKAGLDYLLVAGKLAGLALLVGFAIIEWIPPEPRWLSVPTGRLVVLYALFAGYHELGRLLDRHRRELEVTDEETSEQAEEGPPEEAMAMRAAERYATEQRYSRAARELEDLACEASTSATVHLRYRDLLTLAGDEVGLQWHARTYVPALLAQGKDQEALALYQDSIVADPEFQLEDRNCLSRLMDLAMREHQGTLAISLAQEFLRRFPDQPESVPNGLAAARLMDRQGRPEDARRLLVELVRHFPQHAMRGELVAALETLEDSARRGDRR